MSATDEDSRLLEEALLCADTGAAGHWPTAAGFLADEVRRLRRALAGAGDPTEPADENAQPTHLELYAISGTTDAIADGLDGEARWLVDLAGRLLRDGADVLSRAALAGPVADTTREANHG